MRPALDFCGAASGSAIPASLSAAPRCSTSDSRRACGRARASSQIQIDPLVEGNRVAVATGLPVAGHAGLHQQPLALVVVIGCHLVRQRGARAHDAHPFCQDEKTLKASICWIIGLACRFLYCQWHCGQRIAPANRGYRFAHNKNARRRFEGSGRARRRPLPLSGIVPLGRIPNGTIPRKRRAAT